jgi:ferritin-like metal-binding protein YciE
MKNLEDLFQHFLRDIYFAEKQILKALPKMAKKADSETLRAAFNSHFAETERHVENLETVFERLGLKPRGVTCEAILGILAEAKELMDEAEDADTRDAAMIAAAQAVEHYEINRYGTMVSWAETLGHRNVISLLKANLEQEYAADRKLTEIAESTLNREAVA